MNTSDEDTEVSALDLALHCIECDTSLTLSDDTLIGIRPDRKTPGALCSPECAGANARRLVETGDGGGRCLCAEIDPADRPCIVCTARKSLRDGERCKCGARVDLEQKLLTEAGRILGCAACDWTGRPTPADTHYLSVLGGALCGVNSRIAGKRINTTTSAAAVKCEDCRDDLRLAAICGGVSS